MKFIIFSDKKMLTSYLPPEIITYIFLNLPIKTLLILKSVNKLYFDIISSPDFIKARLKLSSEDVNFSSYRAIMRSGSSCSLKHFSFQSLLSNHLTDLVNLDCPTNESRSLKVFLVGSCNGLVCMTIDKKYFLVWNPCIGKYKNFPCVDVGLCFKFMYGFGYDEPNDDYKVVGIFYFNEDESRDRMVKVYSLKRDSWNTIEDFKGNYMVHDWPKVASGKLHWLSYPLRSEYTRDIVSFDVESEVFGLVERPNYGLDCFDVSLGVLGGCICVISFDMNTRHTDFLVMKEYGVKESWAKMFTIDCIDTLRESLRPSSMLPNGEILLGTVGSFVIYNPKDNSFRLPMIRKWDYEHEPVIYVESLISPVG